MPDKLTIGIISFVIPFITSLSYPVSILLYLPRATRPTRWIQNNPSFSIFLLSSFPIAVCIFSSAVKAEVISHWFAPATWHCWISWAAIVMTLLLLTIITFDDFTRRPIAPFVLRRRLIQEASTLEEELRATGEKASNPRSIEAKRKEYQKLIQLKSLRDILKRGGLVAYVHLAMAWLASLFALVYFWYLIFLLEYTSHNGMQLEEIDKNKLVLIFIILATWFPMRLHTEWYQNHFHRKHWLKEYPAFWTLSFLAFALLILIIFVLQPQGIIVLVWVLNALIAAVIGVLGKFKPEWLRAVADLLQSIPFLYFLAMYLIFFAVVGAVSASAIWFTK